MKPSRLAGITVAAALFGAGMASLKAPSVPFFDVVSNVSALWLPFAGAALIAGRNGWLGAAVGLGLSFVSLITYYWVAAIILLGGNEWLAGFQTEASIGRKFFLAALVSGPLFGALGALWNRGRSVPALRVIVSLLSIEGLIRFFGFFLGFGLGPGLQAHRTQALSASSAILVAGLIALVLVKQRQLA